MASQATTDRLKESITSRMVLAVSSTHELLPGLEVAGHGEGIQRAHPEKYETNRPGNMQKILNKYKNNVIFIAWTAKSKNQLHRIKIGLGGQK